ncbi:hypothetical protein GCM10009795_045600 [Nocardioides hankookensis]
MSLASRSIRADSKSWRRARRASEPVCADCANASRVAIRADGPDIGPPLVFMIPLVSGLRLVTVTVGLPVTAARKRLTSEQSWFVRELTRGRSREV